MVDTTKFVVEFPREIDAETLKEIQREIAARLRVSPKSVRVWRRAWTAGGGPALARACAA